MLPALVLWTFAAAAEPGPAGAAIDISFGAYGGRVRRYLSGP